MTRRVSKRTMLHRLDDFPVVRVHLDNLRSSSARVMVDGVACEVKFPRKARQELLNESGIVGYVKSIPRAIGNGYMPPGTKSGDYARTGTRKTAVLPGIGIFDDYTERVEQAFHQFREAHPIGAIVSGQVLLVNRRVAILDLGFGLQGRLDSGESLDYIPGSKVKWLPLPGMGECLDVMVRGFIPRIRQVSVSLHTFARDDDYCNYSAGYRRRFSSDDASFRKLPWQNKF